MYSLGVKKLENAVLKMYLINAVVNNKPEKITEFFAKMTPELQNQSEWKDWFSKYFLFIQGRSFAISFIFSVALYKKSRRKSDIFTSFY